MNATVFWILRDGRQLAVIEGGIFASALDDPLRLIERLSGDNSLNRIEPTIAAHHNDFVAIDQPMIADQSKAHRKVIVVADYDAAVAPNVHEFHWVQ